MGRRKGGVEEGGPHTRVICRGPRDRSRRPFSLLGCYSLSICGRGGAVAARGETIGETPLPRDMQMGVGDVIVEGRSARGSFLSRVVHLLGAESGAFLVRSAGMKQSWVSLHG